MPFALTRRGAQLFGCEIPEAFQIRKTTMVNAGATQSQDLKSMAPMRMRSSD
jgi:hypothetical protein